MTISAIQQANIVRLGMVLEAERLQRLASMLDSSLVTPSSPVTPNVEPVSAEATAPNSALGSRIDICV